MKFYILDTSIVGYKNKIKNKSSQDYMKLEQISDGLICSIGDGHSNDFFTESYNGAKFACEASIEILKRYMNCNMDEIKVLLENKTIQKEIYNKWRNLVFSHMMEKLPNVFKFNYLKYGTTLLSVMINKDYILYIRLGDGNILINNKNEIKRVFDSYKKVVVDSMAQYEGYENMEYKIQLNKDNVKDVVVFSDGFENSFIYYDEMIKNVKNTISRYKKSVFSKYKLEKKYYYYLENLSCKGSLDDISIVFVNIL